MYRYTILALVLISCAGHERLVVTPNPNQAAVAKSPGTGVEIFETRLPTREYRELGRIDCPDQDQDYCRRMAVKAARRLGADALVILGPTTTQGFAWASGGLAVGQSEHIGLSAVAVAFKD